MKEWLLLSSAAPAQSVVVALPALIGLHNAEGRKERPRLHKFPAAAPYMHSLSLASPSILAHSAEDGGRELTSPTVNYLIEWRR